MTISVIIPVYNAGSRLAPCLDSVREQVLTDWECVLVDDGSTDGSGAVCDRYAAADPRFRAIHTVNRGVSAARNTGLESARAPYIVFVDADDRVAPEYLAALHGALGDADMALCGLRQVRGSEVWSIVPEAGMVTVDAAGAERFVALNRSHLLYGPVAKLYRAALVREVRFPVGVDFGEDLIFNLACLERVRVIAVVGAALYDYLIAPSGSLSTGGQSRDFALNYAQWRLIRDFFARREIAGAGTAAGADRAGAAGAGEAAGADEAAGAGGRAGGRAAGEFLADRLWGLAYDAAMSRRMNFGELRAVFSRSLAADLRAFGAPSIAVPRWLRSAILGRKHLIIWLLQRR